LHSQSLLAASHGTSSLAGISSSFAATLWPLCSLSLTNASTIIKTVAGTIGYCSVLLQTPLIASFVTTTIFGAGATHECQFGYDLCNTHQIFIK
jgi:hypothetical protein